MTSNLQTYRIAIIAAVLISCCFSPVALGQVKLDKQQLDQLEALERMVLYHPHLYGADHLKAFQKRGGKRIDYQTAQGKQTAWLMPQTGGTTPDRLWAVFGGNGSLGLDLEPIARAARLDADAFLFVDYPGYGGLCSGQPSPAGIRANGKESILAAAKLLHIDPRELPDKVSVFGHSLGCAAALLASEELHLRSAVLCALFTSTADMAQLRMGIPKTLALPHSFDNREGLRELAKHRGRAWILHGDKDTIVPVEMSRTLGQEFKESVTLHVVPGGSHNDIFALGKKELFDSMAVARKLPPSENAN
jgi:pimeloyl-ACP methyl ester carboxylesterase